MLVEVIVTSTVIVTTMVVLFAGFNSLLAKYEARNEYHSIDAIYASKKTIDYLQKVNLNSFINQSLYTRENIYLIKDHSCQMIEEICSVEEFCEDGKKMVSILEENFCAALVDLYHVETMIFTTYDKQNLTDLRDGTKDEYGHDVILPVTTETMKEYLDYVIGYYNIQNENIDALDGERKNEYNYMILTEIKDGENYSYASLAIR